MTFTFEKLEVYQKAVLFAKSIENLNESLKSRVSYSIRDQLSRASLSIPLNIAEGNGRWHKNEKKHFFWIARGSIFEVIPILEILRGRRDLSKDEFNRYYQDLTSIAMMMAKLIQSIDRKS